MKKRKVYVASSWRNASQISVVAAIRNIGHDVYDFRNPAEGNTGFSWSEIDAQWKHWDTADYIRGLRDPIAKAAFKYDFTAMNWADTFVLLCPCGRSAHLEVGWAVGQGKETIVICSSDTEPELMILMCDHICEDANEAMHILSESKTR